MSVLLGNGGRAEGRDPKIKWVGHRTFARSLKKGPYIRITINYKRAMLTAFFDSDCLFSEYVCRYQNFRKLTRHRFLLTNKKLSYRLETGRQQCISL